MKARIAPAQPGDLALAQRAVAQRQERINARGRRLLRAMENLYWHKADTRISVLADLLRKEG